MRKKRRKKSTENEEKRRKREKKRATMTATTRPQNDDEPSGFSVHIHGLFVFRSLLSTFASPLRGTAAAYFLLAVFFQLFFVDLWFKCAINQMEIYKRRKRIRTERNVWNEKRKHEKCIGYMSRAFV